MIKQATYSRPDSERAAVVHRHPIVQYPSVSSNIFERGRMDIRPCRNARGVGQGQSSRNGERLHDEMREEMQSRARLGPM